MGEVVQSGHMALRIETTRFQQKQMIEIKDLADMIAKDGHYK